MLIELTKQGPELTKRLKSFISVQQTISSERPEHLPDIQRDVKKIVEETKNPRR